MDGTQEWGSFLWFHELQNLKMIVVSSNQSNCLGKNVFLNPRRYWPVSSRESLSRIASAAQIECLESFRQWITRTHEGERLNQSQSQNKRSKTLVALGRMLGQVSSCGFFLGRRSGCIFGTVGIRLIPSCGEVE